MICDCLLLSNQTGSAPSAHCLCTWFTHLCILLFSLSHSLCLILSLSAWTHILSIRKCVCLCMISPYNVFFFSPVHTSTNRHYTDSHYLYCWTFKPISSLGPFQCPLQIKIWKEKEKWDEQVDFCAKGHVKQLARSVSVTFLVEVYSVQTYFAPFQKVNTKSFVKTKILLLLF